MKKKIIYVCILILVCSFNITIEKEISIHNGGTLYVGGDGPGNYSKIQDAINDANDGDTIFVYSGVYYENLYINKSIKLIGENKNETIIDGNIEGIVINVVSDRVLIKNFKIRNWEIINATGIKVSGDGVVIKNNIITEPNWWGEGLFVFKSQNCSIIKNLFLNSCIILENISYSTIDSNRLSGEYPFFFIQLKNSTNSVISGNMVNNSDGGGVITINSSSIKIYNNSISSNNYAGINLCSSSHNMVQNNLLRGIESGLSIYNSNNNTISNNAILFSIIGIESSNCLNNTISNNVIRLSRIAIYFEDDTECKILENSIVLNGIGIFLFGNDFGSHDNTILNNNLVNIINACLEGYWGPYQKKPKFDNKWLRNYWWNWPSIFPKPIFGVMSRWDGILYPLLNFDFLPRLIPYSYGPAEI